MFISGLKRGLGVVQMKRKNQCLLKVQKSAHNPNMVIQRSVLGESAVHRHPEESIARIFCDGEEGKGQRILCLDGGGVKVRGIICIRASLC